MVTMMEHPQHGRHPATGHEVEALKAQGWTVMPPKQKEPLVVGDRHVELVSAPIEATFEEPRQKRKYTRRAV